MKKMVAVSPTVYCDNRGYSMRREDGTPYGNYGKWVLRNEAGGVIDRDEYRLALCRRNGFSIVDAYDTESGNTFFPS